MPANIVVPEVGESIVDARVAKWLRKEGEVVSAGDPLVELETDKIDLEVGAPQAGVLSRIDRKEGEDVKVGEVLGVIDESAASGASAASPAPSDDEQTGGGRRGGSPERQVAGDADRQEGRRAERRRHLEAAGQWRCRSCDEARRRARRGHTGAVSGTAAGCGRRAAGRSQARRGAAEGAPCRSRRRGAAAPRWRPHRRARAHVQAARDDRQAARRCAAAPRRCCRRSTKST